MEPKKMRSIWYFVGLMLLVVGVIIVLTGLISLMTGAERPTVLANTYPELWWGGLILVSGILFFVIGSKVSGEN